MTPLQFEPDSKYQYSNAGINTAGRIIEVVSGMPYEEFLDKRLFKPLGMKDTTFWPNAEQLQRLAKSYKPAMRTRTAWKKSPIGATQISAGRSQRQPMPAGGLFSTATDLSLFYRMSPTAASSPANGIFPSGGEADDLQANRRFAHALWFRLRRRRRAVGHGGAYNTNRASTCEHQLITIFLVQQAGWGRRGRRSSPRSSKRRSRPSPRAGRAFANLALPV